MKKILLLLCLLSTYMLHAQSNDPIFKDTFEEENFKSQWTARPNLTGTNGVVEIYNNKYYASSESQQSVRLGKIANDGVFTTNALDLKLDLSGYNQVELSFDIYDKSDEIQEEDGLYFSETGEENSFIKVYSFRPEDWCDQYGAFPPFDVDKLAAAHDLSLTSTFTIRFQQYDDADFNSGSDNDGFYIDNVVVRVPPTKYASLPFEDDFEESELDSAWSWSHPDSTTSSIENISPTGVVSLSDDHPNNGKQSVRLGKRCNQEIFTTNALDLHLDLSNYNQVEMVFAIYDRSDETNEEDGIYFSSDGGLTFKKVYDFHPEDWCDQYGMVPPLDVDALASAYGLTLSKQFVIRFQQHDNADFNSGSDNDGFYIDDVRVGNSILPVITSFSPGIAPIDREITITGVNFDSVSQVAFHGVAAEFTIIDSAVIIAKVPEGVTPGPGKISVTNKEGTVESESNFIVSSDTIAAPAGFDVVVYTCFNQLTWTDASDNETGFVIERKNADSVTFETVATLSANAASYADAAIENGIVYDYRVRAINTLGNSPFSEVVSETAQVTDDCGTVPPPQPPAAPSGLSAVSGSDSESRINLSWQDNADNEDGYKVYRKREGGDFEEVTLLGANTTDYSDIGLDFGTTYFYKVVAFNKGGQGESDEAFAKTTPKVLGVNDLKGVSEVLRLFPNPAQSQLQLVLKNELYGQVRIRILNLLGKEQQVMQFDKRQRVVEQVLDVSQLNAGMYFVEVIQDEYRSVQRLAKR